MFTTQAQVRKAFKLEYTKIPDFSGTGKMYKTDTRCAFVDYVDWLREAGEISDKMADSVTLG